jgi:hypothetical protein
MPFLYKNFDQLIFYDLSAFSETPEFSSDGSHEYIQNYPDPEEKITLIEQKDLSNVVPLGESNIIKRKMFSLGSTYVKNDIDVFWCTDMDEFFREDLIKAVEGILSKENVSIQLDHFNFWRTHEYILTQDKNLLWDFGDLLVRICKHTPGNKYGHCSIGKQYPIHKLENHYLYHFAWIGNDRIKNKFIFYLNNGLTGNISENYTKIWEDFSPEKLDKEIYGYPKMHPNSGLKSGLVKSPVDVFSELPYLDQNIIKEMTKYSPFKILYLSTHTGLGDHCICYGLVKELSKQNDLVFLFTKNEPNHLQNVKRLYGTIKNVKILAEDPKKYGDRVLIIGGDKFFSDFKKDKSLGHEKYFYNQAGVPFNLKWDNFYLDRNMEKEKDIFYNVLKLKDEEPFIFLHEDVQRGYRIERKYLSPNCRIINISDFSNISIFDLIYTIERAKEVHVINSSLVCFIDIAQIKNSNLIYHKYTRPGSHEQPIFRLNWKIIENR